MAGLAARVASGGRRGADAHVRREVREAVLAIDPSLPPPRVSTLEQATDIVLLPQRAGAIVIGARKFLVAYNVNLTTIDVRLAKALAEATEEEVSADQLPLGRDVLSRLIYGSRIALTRVTASTDFDHKLDCPTN